MLVALCQQTLLCTRLISTGTIDENLSRGSTRPGMGTQFLWLVKVTEQRCMISRLALGMLVLVTEKLYDLRPYYCSMGVGRLAQDPSTYGDEDVFKFGSRELQVSGCALSLDCPASSLPTHVCYQIDETVLEADYLSGKCFNNRASQSTIPKTVSVQPFSSGSFYGPSKVVPPKKFST